MLYVDINVQHDFFLVTRRAAYKIIQLINKTKKSKSKHLRYNMDVLYSIEDLIAAFGGLFGLCTGASLLRSYLAI